ELAALKIPVVTVGDLREWGADALARATAQSYPATGGSAGPGTRRGGGVSACGTPAKGLA
ncbi:hypothetical protein ABZ918_32085, partial [Streptomyces viridosporus]